MPAPILATKLYIPPSRRSIVLRPRLVERLNEGLASGNKLTPAGFGKTTLVGEWLADCGRPAAWLSLDQPVEVVLLVAIVRTAWTWPNETPTTSTTGRGATPHNVHHAARRRRIRR